jgi:hypothetical protein
LKAAIADAEQRGVPELKPMLEALAKATIALRNADFTPSLVTNHRPPNISRQS